jgi:peptidyl-dipeptidase A
MWRSDFETETFVEDMENLWKEVEPLYLELHTYVKNKLKKVYGDKIGDDDLIPAHILGSFCSFCTRPLCASLVPSFPFVYSTFCSKDQ